MIDVSEQALELAKRLNAAEMVGPAMAVLSQGLAMRGHEGDMDQAMELGERALRAWAPGTKPVDLAEHDHMLANQYYWTGRYERALELARAAQEQAVDPTSGESLLRGGGLVGLTLTELGRYEEALASFDAVIALGRELGRPVRVLLNYSTTAFRELFDLGEARQRSEEALAYPAKSPNFHMPWMNAIVDLIHADVLAGEMGAAESRWRNLYDEVLATPAWERWFLGSKMAAFRAAMALEAEGPEVAAEWAQKAIEMARPVHRAKYEAQARGTLGKALVAMGRTSQGLDELRSAAEAADALGSPAGRWQAQADLARALSATGDDDGAGRTFREAADTLRQIAGALTPERAERFTAAPQVAEVLKAAG
jgi:tetratricopeptide (TPR) repeat protein